MRRPHVLGLGTRFSAAQDGPKCALSAGSASYHRTASDFTSALIEKYWNSFANTWFEGKDDPRISVIGVTATDGYYYETKENKVVAMAKMIFAAVTGAKNEDGGVEGELKI